MKKLLLGTASLVVGITTLLANGGAWQTGVPGLGSATAKNRKTDVTIEDEKLKIDLLPEYASVEVNYRMHNAGPKVEQEFFFPVERWKKNPGADTDPTNADVDQYQINVDGKELRSTDIAGPKEKGSETKEETRKASKLPTNSVNWRAGSSTIKLTSSSARIRIVSSRWIFIMAAQLRIRWVILFSTARPRSIRGIGAPCLKSV